MLRRLSLAALVLSAAGIGASCGLLRQRMIEPPVETPAPFALPTTTAKPAGDERIEGEMRAVGPCLTIVVIRNNTVGPTILPIWPAEFSATGMGGGIRLIGPLSVPPNDAVGSERLELHGKYVDQPPSDTDVPAECIDYQLFLVGRALNIAK